MRKRAPPATPPLLHPRAIFTQCYALLLDEHENIRDSEMAHILSALPQSQVVKLHLLGTRMTVPNVARLAAAIAQTLTLRTVHLHNLELEDAGIIILSRALLDNPKITDFVLSRSHLDSPIGLGPVASRSIRKLLIEHPNLVHVDFRGTLLGPHGVSAVAAAIRHNHKRLIALGLQQTGLNETGVAEIAYALVPPRAESYSEASNPSAGTRLLHLDLGGNPDIGDPGAREIAWTLASPSTQIRELDLSGCRLSDLGATYLAEALEVNQRLHHLILLNNMDITADGIDEFIQVLQDKDHGNADIGYIEVTRHPHNSDLNPAFHDETTKRYSSACDRMDEILSENRESKKKSLSRAASGRALHAHWPHHPKRMWHHEGTVAGEMSIVSLDGEAAHIEPPKGVLEREHIPLPHEGAPYQPIQGGIEGIMERVNAGHQRDGEL